MTGFLRIIKKEDSDPQPKLLKAGDSGSPQATQPIERIVKLIPAEVMAIYAMGTPWGFQNDTFWIIGCTIFCVAFRGWGTTSPKGPQWLAIGIATVSFLLWQSVTQGGAGIAGVSLGIPTGYTPAAMLLWTAIVPIFYKGD